MADSYFLLVIGAPIFWLLLTLGLLGWLFTRTTKINPFFALLFFLMSGNLGASILRGVETLSNALNVWVAIGAAMVTASLHFTVEPLHEVLTCQESAPVDQIRTKLKSRLSRGGS